MKLVLKALKKSVEHRLKMLFLAEKLLLCRLRSDILSRVCPSLLPAWKFKTMIPVSISRTVYLVSESSHANNHYLITRIASFILVPPWYANNDSSMTCFSSIRYLCHVLLLPAKWYIVTPTSCQVNRYQYLYCCFLQALLPQLPSPIPQIRFLSI